MRLQRRIGAARSRPNSSLGTLQMPAEKMDVDAAPSADTKKDTAPDAAPPAPVDPATAFAAGASGNN